MRQPPTEGISEENLSLLEVCYIIVGVSEPCRHRSLLILEDSIAPGSRESYPLATC